ncbi:TetR family transcriptional regulator [Gordonia sp. (in: high G+C Gram-positive bacteria)]|uniref:TetR family transcriptional regulator n=1 Tax=Gordonia sp. (in: high G+C Gram-positive bacteria) TaxID=84139 RepID=UPI0033400543
MEERRARRRKRLLDEASNVIADEGVDAIKVRSLSRRAGLNDRYFYESFSNIEALLETLVSARIADALVALSVAAASTSDSSVPTTDSGESIEFATMIEATVASALDIVEDRTVARLMIQSRQYAPLRRLRRLLVDSLVDLTEERGRSQLGDKVVEGKLPGLVATAAMEGVLELIIRWLEGEFKASRSEVQAAAIALITGLEGAVQATNPPRSESVE